ncbi:hypothetical protein NMG60_11032089 [Bertholletia excelsa]
MLVAMSTQLLVGPSPGTKDIHPFTDAAMVQESSLVGLVVHKLLLNCIMRPQFDLNTGSHELSSEEYELSVLQRLASFVPLPFNYFVSSSGEANGNPLADRSLEVLLILIHYRKYLSEDKMKDSCEDSTTTDFLLRENTSFYDNPFCKALQNARDMQFDLVDIMGKAPSGQPVRLPFASLFDTLSMYLADETSVLLLYTLVEGNSNFLEYVLVRADIDTLLMPLLETLYDAPKRASNQIYLVLIVLLILSQDSSFNASVHKLILARVPWYQEHCLHQMSLGSLMFIILIRTVKYNLSKMHDVYLHTNCLATLANMAPHVHHLSSYASQRLVSLFDMLVRKYNKLAELKNHINGGNGKSREENLPEDLVVTSTEMHIYTDFLKLVLEIINGILTYTLPRNPEVVYTILHRQEVFLPLKNHPHFNELLDNIYTVLDFFNTRVDAQRMEGEWSVEKVLEVIIINCRSWRGEGLMMFNQLRFTYEQESHTEEFFIPYVWQLAISHWGFSFNPSSIKLFSVDLPVKDNFASEDNEHQDGQQNEQALETDLPVSQNPIGE